MKIDLLDFDLRAGRFDLLLDLFGFGLGHAFFQGLGSAFDQGFRFGQTAMSRQETRHNFSTMASVDFEIFVGGEQQRIRENLGHSNKTCVCNAHRHVVVFF